MIGSVATLVFQKENWAYHISFHKPIVDASIDDAKECVDKACKTTKLCKHSEYGSLGTLLLTSRQRLQINNGIQNCFIFKVILHLVISYITLFFIISIKIIRLPRKWVKVCLTGLFFKRVKSTVFCIYFILSNIQKSLYKFIKSDLKSEYNLYNLKDRIFIRVLFIVDGRLTFLAQ